MALIRIIAVWVLISAQIQALPAPEGEEAPNVSIQVDIDVEGHCDALPRKLAQRYVFDVIRKKCVSTLEPDCPENMELRSIPGNETYGLCDCVRHRPTVYNSSTDTCNLLYRQEFCEPGQWLLPTPQAEGICSPNQCNPSKTIDPNKPELEEWTLFNGDCAVIGSRNSCPQNDEILVYITGELQPKCAPIPKVVGGSGNRGFVLGGVVPNLQCSPGTKWSQLTHNCQTPRHFNFS